MKETEGPADGMLPNADEATAALAAKGIKLESENAPSAFSQEDFRPDLLDRLTDRLMPKGDAALGAAPILKRRQVSFLIDGAECEPDVFTTTAGEYIVFKVTMRSLSSAEEIDALSGLKHAQMAPMLLARASFVAVNDKPIPGATRDFWWEALGMAGRQLCFLAFQSIGAASTGALGKFQSSRSES